MNLEITANVIAVCVVIALVLSVSTLFLTPVIKERQETSGQIKLVILKPNFAENTDVNIITRGGT